MGFRFVREYEATRVSRIASLLSLVVATATVASAAPVDPSPTTALVFEFSWPVSDDAWQTMATALAHADLSRLLGSPVVLVQRQRIAKGTEFLDVIQVALSGDCVAGRDFDSASSSDPLGWVYLVDGRIEPFVFVDCAPIARMLQRELREKPLSERGQVIACAVSFVIVHELTHISMQDSHHEETGLLKAHATKIDLLPGVRDIPRQAVLGAPKRAACPAYERAEVSAAEGDVR